MGIYENQLNQIASAPEWNVEHLDGLKAIMNQLDADMIDIAKAPGWTGVSAEAARTHFLLLQEQYERAAARLEQARTAIQHANDAKRRAASKRSSLPDAAVPDWVHTAALIGGSILVPVPGIGTFAAETVVQRVNQFLGAQREAAAHQVLTDLQRELSAPAAAVPNKTWPSGPPSPDFPGPPVVWTGDDTGAGGWSTGGSYGGSGTGGVNYTPDTPTHVSSPPPYPPVVLPPKPPTGWPGSTIGLDGDTSGTTGGGFGGGGALGAGMLGVGGLAAASKLARGGLGAGGSLAGSGAGAGGLGVAGGMGGGAGSGAAGGRSSSAMMGGGAPGGGGGSEKEKRNGLGLIAPKLEDDDEMGPRSAAAGAGGRE